MQKDIESRMINEKAIENLKIKMILNKLSNIPERKQTLQILEDEIYTINGEKLSDSEKVQLELKRIKVKLSEKKSAPPRITKMLDAIDNVDLNIASADALELCKRQIVLMELSLSMDITFFNAAYDLLNAKQQEERRGLSKWVISI